MGFIKRKNNDGDYEVSDILIVFDEDHKTTDICRVDDVREGAVIVEDKYHVPMEDTQLSTGKEGRVFYYGAPAESIKVTENLAKLERNMVLTQITRYKPPVLPTGMDWTKGLLFAVIVLLVIVVIIK